MAVIIARGLINVVIETDAFRKLTDLSVEGIRIVNEDSIIGYINTCRLYVTSNKCNNLMLFLALLGIVRHLSFSLYCLLFILLVILSL